MHQQGLREGLSAFEGGEAMDRARATIESLLLGDEGGAGSNDLDEAILEVTLTKIYVFDTTDFACSCYWHSRGKAESNVVLVVLGLAGQRGSGAAHVVHL